MSETTTGSRRRFLTGGAAALGATALGPLASTSAAEQAGYVLDAPDVVSMEVDGSDDRFPVRRVYCLGRNYRAHAIESGDNPDETPPFFFMKPEVELVVALKSGGLDIDRDDALDHVYAYGVGLDMTREDLQHVAQELSRPWAISKSFDHSAPCGPLHTVEKNGHAETGRIWLSVNGEIRQDSDLDMQRWSVSEGIATLSKYYKLSAGDIIMTGTPAGIGLVVKGDTIKCGIQGIGEIEVQIT